MGAPVTDAELRALSDDDLACHYCSELDEDPEAELPRTRLFKEEATRRGLSHNRLLELWNRQHDVD